MGNKDAQENFDKLIKLLEQDEDVPIRILPNGEIVEAPGPEVKSAHTGQKMKPLTMREDLGGEYAA